MTGSNCAFPGCETNRRSKFRGISIFKIPNRKTETYIEWKKSMLAVINKYRISTNDYKDRAEDGKIYVCERHFEPSDIELTSKYIFLC